VAGLMTLNFRDDIPLLLALSFSGFGGVLTRFFKKPAGFRGCHPCSVFKWRKAGKERFRYDPESKWRWLSMFESQGIAVRSLLDLVKVKIKNQIAYKLNQILILNNCEIGERFIPL